jgi:hypothetical protein
MPNPPKWQQEFEKLKQDSTVWPTLKPAIRRTLQECGLVDAAGNVMAPPVPEKWRVEFVEQSGNGLLWHPVVSSMGEKMVFDSQEYAEMQARKLSVMNNRQYRVIQGTSDTFFVWDDGQRLVRTTINGIPMRLDIEVLDIDDSLEEGIETYQLEMRLHHIYNNGNFALWGSANNREYPDLESAVEDAKRFSRSKPKNEYRTITVMNGTPVGAMVYQSGEP